jgi:protein-tyrosine phosphatase
MDRTNLADLRRMAGGSPDISSRIQLLRSFDPAASAGAEVPDPYYGSPDDYAQVFTLVEAAADGLVAQLAAEL